MGIGKLLAGAALLAAADAVAKKERRSEATQRAVTKYFGGNYSGNNIKRSIHYRAVCQWCGQRGNQDST
ncbi:MAG: hypothetical protein II936_01415, partial [Oscillospiraceae bacterium]|nr:hypothetical protein [Oscillospiraceae bacterium]